MLEKLNTDKIKSSLKTKFIGREIILLANIDSTQDYAQTNLATLANGVLILAESQNRGRGRFGRVWHSPYGKAIYMSIILKDNFRAELLPQVTLLTSFSLAKYLHSEYGLDIKVRWPNDVILGKDKIAGILAETKSEAIIIGIGLNVNQNLQELPESATSLFLHLAREQDRNYLIAQFLNHFEKDYCCWLKKGYKFLRELWLAYASLKGKKVVAKTNFKVIRGVVEDLASDCGLILREDFGYQLKINFNEVIKIR